MDSLRNSLKSVTTYLTTGQLKKAILIFTTLRVEMSKYWWVFSYNLGLLICLHISCFQRRNYWKLLLFAGKQKTIQITISTLSPTCKSTVFFYDI